jgi:hypothetical protein
MGEERLDTLSRTIISCGNYIDICTDTVIILLLLLLLYSIILKNIMLIKQYKCI